MSSGSMVPRQAVEARHPAGTSTMPDEREIRRLVDVFVAGWNAGDGNACASSFAQDADHATATGLKTHGRDLIARLYQTALSTVFRRTRLNSAVNGIRFVRSDVAVAELTLRVHDEDGAFIPEPYPAEFAADLVAAKRDGRWSIVAFRNVIPVGPSRGAAG